MKLTIVVVDVIITGEQIGWWERLGYS